MLNYLKVTNNVTGSQWEGPLDKEQSSLFQGIVQKDNSCTGASRQVVLLEKNPSPKDHFLWFSTSSYVKKIKNIVVRIFVVMTAMVLDGVFLPLRVVTWIPKALLGEKERKAVHKYLEEQGAIRFLGSSDFNQLQVEFVQKNPHFAASEVQYKIKKTEKKQIQEIERTEEKVEIVTPSNEECVFTPIKSEKELCIESEEQAAYERNVVVSMRSGLDRVTMLHLSELQHKMFGCGFDLGYVEQIENMKNVEIKKEAACLLQERVCAYAFALCNSLEKYMYSWKRNRELDLKLSLLDCLGKLVKITDDRRPQMKNALLEKFSSEGDSKAYIENLLSAQTSEIEDKIKKLNPNNKSIYQIGYDFKIPVCLEIDSSRGSAFKTDVGLCGVASVQSAIANLFASIPSLQSENQEELMPNPLENVVRSYYGNVPDAIKGKIEDLETLNARLKPILVELMNVETVQSMISSFESFDLKVSGG